MAGDGTDSSFGDFTGPSDPSLTSVTGGLGNSALPALNVGSGLSIDTSAPTLTSLGAADTATADILTAPTVDVSPSLTTAINTDLQNDGIGTAPATDALNTQLSDSIQTSTNQLATTDAQSNAAEAAAQANLPSRPNSVPAPSSNWAGAAGQIGAAAATAAGQGAAAYINSGAQQNIAKTNAQAATTQAYYANQSAQAQANAQAQAAQSQAAAAAAAARAQTASAKYAAQAQGQAANANALGNLASSLGNKGAAQPAAPPQGAKAPLKAPPPVASDSSTGLIVGLGFFGLLVVGGIAAFALRKKPGKGVR